LIREQQRSKFVLSLTTSVSAVSVLAPYTAKTLTTSITTCTFVSDM